MSSGMWRGRADSVPSMIAALRAILAMTCDRIANVERDRFSSPLASPRTLYFLQIGRGSASAVRRVSSSPCEGL